MGGNALSRETLRLRKTEYDALALDAVARLQAAFPQARVHAIASYRNKPDFGDLDILVESTDYDPHRAAQALDAVEVVRNGPVTSVGVVVLCGDQAPNGPVFQVDLIESEPESFDFAACYFSYNDLSNLLGRIAHALGVTLRHDGLVYYLRDGDYLFAEIVLTRDYLHALPFMGYDPARYQQGFDGLEDIFQFVASTPFFNPDIYLLHNRNNASRVRDRKRPTYNAFLRWCAERPGLTAFVYPEDKSAWLPRVMEHFPDFAAQYQQAQQDLARQRELKSRFNGAWVAQLTGLEGKALGALMQQIKASFPSVQAFHDFVLHSTPDERAQWVHRIHRGWQEITA